MRSSLYITLALAAAWACGCGQQAPRFDARATADENFNAVWDASLEVLRQYRFEVDRADRRSGTITTFPLVGRHWFEFWRKDAIAPYDVAEGTIQTLYRQVTITIYRREPVEPSPQPLPETVPATMPGRNGDYYVTVVARTSRSNRPIPMVTSTSEAYDLFLGTVQPVRTVAPGAQPGRTGRYEPQPEYAPTGVTVDIGRDHALERRLEQEVNALAAKRLTVVAP